MRFLSRPLTTLTRLGIPLTLGATVLAEGESAYPPARTVDQVDSLHGVEVADPYRWMEELESAELDQWIHAQDDLFNQYVHGHAGWEAVHKRVGELTTPVRMRAPLKADSTYFMITAGAAPGTMRISVADSIDGPRRLILDSNTAAPEDGDTLIGFRPSPDGKHVVFGVTDGPAGLTVARVMNVATGELMPERILGMYRFGPVFWASNSKSFYYLRFDEAAPEEAHAAVARIRNPRILHHRVGAPIESDQVIYAHHVDSERLPLSFALTTDDRFIVMPITNRSTGRVWTTVIDLEEDGSREPKLLFETEGLFQFIDNDGPAMRFATDHEAPNRRIIALDVESPEPENWTTFVPEREDQILRTPSRSATKIFGRYERNGRITFEMFDQRGTPEGELQTGPLGGGVGLTTSPRHDEVFLTTSSVINPGSIHRVDVRDRSAELVLQTPLPIDFDQLVLEQTTYPNRDGQDVPMYIARRKDTSFDGSAPVWMYGFGSGGWVAFPWFQPHLLAWIDMGGVFALPGIRGGGEHGQAWADAGMRLNKQNTFNDFIDAAQWLVDQDMAKPGRIVANGGSASGVLPAVVIQQRPDLFGVSVVEFPILDFMRYHHTSRWTASFGSPEEPDYFPLLLSYSPYHNVEDGACSRPMLVTVATSDVTTAPWHGYKFVAAAQRAQSCDQPILLQLAWGVGHYNYGATVEDATRTRAAQITFALRALEEQSQ